MPQPVEGLVGVGSMSAHVLARSPLIADYVDHFAIEADFRATPERCARALFGDVPSAGEVFIWRGLLQLRLRKKASSHTVAGWQITEITTDWIRLETRSHSLTVNLVVTAANGRLGLTTFVRYDRRLGQWAWAPLSAIHRKLAPPLLVETVARLR